MDHEALKKQFLSEFKDESWLETYVLLRLSGDRHSEAVETIRAEMQIERLNRKQFLSH